MTVGELARKMGVTVRAIQYYDQQGLLSPSAKGPQNQRFYSSKDATDLSRILTLKYLGLSLAEIKESQSGLSSSKEFHDLADSKLDALDENFQDLFRRLTALRVLMEDSKDANDMNWDTAFETISHCQDEDRFFWRIVCTSESGTVERTSQDKLLREEAVSKWHELIADAIRLQSTGMAANTPQGLDIGRRYLQLEEKQQTFDGDQAFILMENVVPVGGDNGAFDALRKTVSDYLDEAVAAYREKNGLSSIREPDKQVSDKQVSDKQ